MYMIAPPKPTFLQIGNGCCRMKCKDQKGLQTCDHCCFITN